MKSVIIFITVCLTAANAAKYSYVREQEWPYQSHTNCSGAAYQSTDKKVDVCIPWLPSGGLSSVLTCVSDGTPFYLNYDSADCTGEYTSGSYNLSCQAESSKFSCIEDLESIPEGNLQNVLGNFSKVFLGLLTILDLTATTTISCTA